LHWDPVWLRDAARARRQPLDDEIKEMNALLEAAAFGRDEDEQAQAARRLIDRVVRCYDIDVRHVNGPMTLDPDVMRKAERVGGDRRVRLGYSAFLDDVPELAALVVHQVTHVNQATLCGGAQPPSQQFVAYEAMAYATGVRDADILGLSQEQRAHNDEMLHLALDALHPDNRRLMVEAGRYCGLREDVPPPPAEVFERLAGTLPSRR
jgi:hypothetical protein